MRPAGAGQFRGGPPQANTGMQPTNPAMLMAFGSGNGLVMQQLFQGGQLGLGGLPALQMGMNGQQQQSNMPVQSWSNGMPSQAQVPTMQGHMQQQQRQQQPRQKPEAQQPQQLTRKQRKALRKHEQELAELELELQKQQQQEQQFPPPPAQLQQPQYPLPPAGAPPAAASATVAPAAANISRWDTGGQSTPPWKQQTQQLQQLDLRGAGQQLQLLSEQQQHQLHLSMFGKGHEHIPVLELGRLSSADPTQALVLDRLDSNRTPALQHMPEQPAAAAAAAVGLGASMPVGVPREPAAEAAPLFMQAPGPPPPAAAASAAAYLRPVPQQMQQQSMPQQLQQTDVPPPRPPPEQALQQQQQQAAIAMLGGPPRPPKQMVAMQPHIGQLLQSAAGSLQSLLDMIDTLTQDASQISTLPVDAAVQAAELITAAAAQQQEQSADNDQPQQQQRKQRQHPGVKGLCKWLLKVLPDMSAVQLLLLPECLAALASAGWGHISNSCINDVIKAVAQSGALDDSDSFLATAAAVTTLAASAADSAAAPGAAQLLTDSVMRKLFRDDADGGCRLLLEVLIGLHLKAITLPGKTQESVIKMLLDQLPRFTPPQLAALLACHSQLGLDSSSSGSSSSSYGKFLRRTAAEYMKRPVVGPSVDLLLGVLSGLAAGGYATVRELPHQLLPKLCDELQPLLPVCSSTHLLRAPVVLAQLGCLKLNSPKQQQLVNTLLGQLHQRRLELDIYLGLGDLLDSLQGIESSQHQQGLVLVLKDLRSMQEDLETAVTSADVTVILKLVAGLQQLGQFQGHVEQLGGRVLGAIAELVQPSTAAAAAAGEEQQQQQGLDSQLRHIEQLRAVLSEFSLQEIASIVEVVTKLPEGLRSGSSDGSSSSSSDGMPHGGSEVAQLLDAILQSDVLVFRHVSGTAAAAAVDPTTAAAADGNVNADPEAVDMEIDLGGPPPPPPAAGAAAADQQQQRSAAVAPPPPPPAAAGDAAAAAAASTIVPVVFSDNDWCALADLLLVCVGWYSVEQVPQQLVQVMIEVVEAQALNGGIHNCSAAAAVDILWGLAVAGALLLELWDALAVALDKPDAVLSQQQLQRIFEAYGLVVLRVGGPTPRPVPDGQLAAAAEAFWNAAVAPVAAQRQQLLNALAAADLLAGQQQQELTQLGDGHLMLFDVVLPESHQAWVVSGSRPPLVAAASELLLSRYGWVQLQVSAAQVNPPAAAGGNLESGAPESKETLQQLLEVAQLIPKIAALLRSRSGPDQQQQQQLDQLDAASLAGLSKVVDHLRSAIRSGTLIAALPPAQIAMLKHIADMHQGPVAVAAAELPVFGSARLQRLAAAAAAALAGEQSAGGPEESESDVSDDDQIADEDYDPNAMNAQELFVHNRIYLSVDDPWWFCQRLLVQDAAAAAAAPTAAGAQSGTLTLPPPVDSAAALRVAQAAAAAALVVKAQWQQQQLAERAAENAARAAAGLSSLEEEAAAAAAAAEQAAAAAAAVIEVDQDDHVGDRSPRQQQRQRKRHWRESRSRSRSRSVSSSYDTDSGIPEEQEEFDFAVAARDKQAAAQAGSSSSSEEEGAISSDEEGQISDDGADQSPRWAAAAAARSRSRSTSRSRSRSRDRREGAYADAAMPQSFAGRGVLSYAARQLLRQQQQPPAGKRRLARGRKRSRSSSSSRGGSSSSSRSQSHDRGWADRRRPLRRGRQRSSSESPDQRTRSRSPLRQRHRPAFRSRSGSPSHVYGDQEHNAAATAAAAAAAPALDSAQQQQQQLYPAAALDPAQQQQQLYQAAILAAAAAEAAATAKAAAQAQAQQQRMFQALQQQQLLAQQQKQQQQAMALQAAQQKQKQKQLAYAKQATWLPRFSALPISQARLSQLLRKNIIWPGDIHDSAIAAALQLDDEKLLKCLSTLADQIKERREKDRAKAAKAVAEGKEAPKPKKHTGEVNGKLVQICRAAGATAPIKQEKVVKTGFSGVGAAAFGGGFGGFGAAAGASPAAGAAAVPAAAAAAPYTAAAAAAPYQTAAAAAPYTSAAAPGAVGYMYVNGMLVPVSAAAAAAAAAAGYGYGAVAAAPYTTAASTRGAAAAVVGAVGSSKPAKRSKAAAAAVPAAAAAGSGSGARSAKRSAAGAIAPQQQQQYGSGQGSSKTMNQYWEALCSGLGADGDQYSDVEDEPKGGGKKRNK